MKNRKRKIFAKALIVSCIAAAGIYADVQFNGSPIYAEVGTVPVMPVAIVFGSGINTAIALDRVDRGVELYKAGKVKKLLMTGDNGTVQYDEPTAMKNYAVKQGVPAQDIACDYAGFRTYDSLYRARDIFCIKSAVLVTQRFHLPRAIFLAKKLGLTAVGFDAAPHSSYGGWAEFWFNLRELGAVEKAWFDIALQIKPKFLGKQEPIIVDS